MKLINLLRKFHIIHTWEYYEVDIDPTRKSSQEDYSPREIENKRRCIKCNKQETLGREHKYFGEL